MEKFYKAAMLQPRGLNWETMNRLIGHFGSAEQLWHRSVAELRASGLADENVLLQWQRIQQGPDLPQQIAEDCQKHHIKLCQLSDEEYPSILREIFNPPGVLYYRGTLQPEALRIAIVGSRRASQYGAPIATALGRDLAAAGVTVVSGAARGIDTKSHQGALTSGRTVAVLGCGVDVAYPPENAKLLESIAEVGAVISAYPPGTHPLPAYFPERNHIISGLSRGTVVVEAAKRSGSLITANAALQEGRDVFAVPGSIFSTNCQGCNSLIRQGATLITSAQDILEEYHLLVDKSKSKKKKKSVPAGLNGEEILVYKVLSTVKPLSMDEIIMCLPEGRVSNIAFTLLQMQLKGLVQVNEHNEYLRVRRK